ncbi:MAG: HlyD family efflux transporter periplasmic adaptor subunit [Anaerostipes sp.]|jgi:hypothetical protein
MKTKKIHWNIGLIVFVALFAYMLVHVFIYLGKDKISVYKVTQDSVVKAYSFSGIAIRDESLMTADQSGYITYYVNDGKRVIKNSVFFVIDANGEVQKELSNQSKKTRKSISSSDQDSITSLISDYEAMKSDDSFSSVYDLKNDLNNILLAINSTSIDKIISNINRDKTSFSSVKSNASGVCSFYSDNFDDKTMDDIKKSDFNQEKYRVEKYNSSSKVSKGDVVARIAKNETWNIVVSLNKKQYEALKEKTSVSILFSDDGIKSTAKIKALEKDKDYFAYLTLNDYCVRYYDLRYINLDIIMDSFSGYKIPNSSIVKKSFYRVPAKYISKGNNSNKNGFTVRSSSKSGETKVEQKNYTIYKETKNYCYLDPNDVEEGTTFIGLNGEENYTVSDTVTLKGVYCTNQGYADFRVIDIISKEGNYTMINKDTKNGIDAYDFIVLDSNTMEENQIIY